MMRVIITGGTGLIGSHLAASLAKDGHEVIVLSRHPARHRQDVPQGVRAEEWDARSAAGWGHLADGAGAIVNLAGENLSAGRWTDSQKKKIINSRLNAGRAVAQAVEQASQKPGVVIQSSGTNYYGPHGDEVLTEESPPGNDFLARLCVDWEGSTAAVEAMGVRRAITRSGVVLSREAVAFRRLVLPFRFFIGGPLGNGRQWLPWIHIADEIAAVRFLIDNPSASGPFNLTAPDTITNRRLAQLIGQVLNRPAILPVPALALRLALGEMSTVVLDGQRVIPARLQDLGYTFRFPEAEAALRDLLKQ